MSGFKVVFALLDGVAWQHKTLPHLENKHNERITVANFVITNLHVVSKGTVHLRSRQNGVETVVLGWAVLTSSTTIVHTRH